MKLIKFTLFIFLVCCASFTYAQREAPIVSPEVHEDGSVTFRINAPKADEVQLQSGEIETVLGPDLEKKFAKDERGIWSLTIPAIPPGIYDYTINVDGVSNTDPSSPYVFGNRRGSRGYVEVPGRDGQPRHDEWRDVPHGSVTILWYQSNALEGAQRRVHVYLPPDYFQNPDKEYPILYLLHGSGDNDSHWMWIGRANVIADNLIADGKAEPLIIAMPDGHASLEQKPGEDREAFRVRNSGSFEKDLLEEVVPLVESSFRVKEGRENRAIVGLSMGGGQSLSVGLMNLDKFAWIGGFSSAARGLDDTLATLAENADETNEKIKLLWIAIGRDDFLLERNQQFIKQLQESKIEHTYKETEGRHQWSVWRNYLDEFIPLLFKSER
ncbi:MAG: alpha/beta hydrolase-fold protein [bacterium]